MSMLGRGDLLHRATAVVRGLLRPGLPAAAAGKPCLVIGHRGAARVEAENTLASFDRALELGADTVEVDVSVTSDGRFALWHDADPDEKVAVARQLGVEKLAFRPRVPAVGSRWRRPVRELRAEELAEHYGYEPDGSDSPGERVGIAWLEDLQAWARGTGVRHVFLDIKLAGDQAEPATRLVARLREDADSEATTFHLLSPRSEIVRALVRAGARESASLRTSADLELPAPEIAELTRTGARDVSLGAGGRVWPGYRHDVGRMLRARDSGLFGAVVAWTINDRKRLELLVGAGVDGILTDEPALLRRIVKAAGRGFDRA
jgi:glycerophosphoryl diester phosphodiesterase